MLVHPGSHTVHKLPNLINLSFATFIITLTLLAFAILLYFLVAVENSSKAEVVLTRAVPQVSTVVGIDMKMPSTGHSNALV